MNASGVLERLLAFAQAVVGGFRGGRAHVNVVANLIFSGMSGSAIADAAGPGLIVGRMMTRDGRYPPGFADANSWACAPGPGFIVARMMTREGRYPAGFAAATSVASATVGPLVPPSIAMIFYA